MREAKTLYETPKAFKVKRDHPIALRKVFYGSGNIRVFGEEKGDATSMRGKAAPKYEWAFSGFLATDLLLNSTACGLSFLLDLCSSVVSNKRHRTVS